jgi:UDP-N-acetylmuramoyl-L-alanyl-D-glutamate--2,6-diaminopimelate ligase
MRGMTLELAGLTWPMRMGGMHNAYNAAAAVAAGSVLGISPAASLSSLTTLKPRFGRGEEFRSTDKSVWLMLMKNPGGAGPAIAQLASEPNLGSVLVCISDLAADGRDVSWIWDTDFETLAGLDVHLVAGGRRAIEAAVRFRYAGRAPDTVASETRAAVNIAIARCPPGRAVGILATYSSLLEIRQILQHSKRLRVIDQTEF